MPTRDAPWVDDQNFALFTDLYELTMAQAYVEEGLDDQAVFSLFVRRLPAERNYLMACGLASVLRYLENLRFGAQEIYYLASLGRFSETFLNWLSGFRFTGSVHAVPEGTPVFANTPILEVTAPIAEAQLVETMVMNRIHVETVLASKAARVVEAAAGRTVVDFAARRMHGAETAVNGARAFYIAGVNGTSNVLAGRMYDIPVAGTMAHSYVQAHDDEMEAFRRFVATFPDTILLVDTYDTMAGVSKVCALANELGDEFRVRGIRLDSGDLGALSVAARRMLDEAGLQRVQIFASGGLDENAIARLVASGAPIDAFGVVTDMGVANDRPALDIAYKLCEFAGRGRLKLSPGKPILPGRKQVFRRYENGFAAGDTIARGAEALPGTPLLRPVMRKGRAMSDAFPSLRDVRAYAADQKASLPKTVQGLGPAEPAYPVSVSEALTAYQDEVTQAVAPV